MHCLESNPVSSLQTPEEWEGFEVQAVNGVSGKSPLPPRYAAVNITTNQAGEEGTWEGRAWFIFPHPERSCLGPAHGPPGGPWDLGPWGGCQSPRSPC